MRAVLAPALLLALAAGLWLAVGPWGVAALAGVALLARWRGRWAGLRPRRPWGVAGVALAAAVVAAGLLVAWPERWVPALPGPAGLVLPAYDGRPAAERPLPGPRGAPGRPDLPVPHPGPVGDLPRTDAGPLGWPGAWACAPATRGLVGRLTLCDGAEGARAALLGPGSVETTGTLALPGDPTCAPVGAATARGTVLAATDGRTLVELAGGDRAPVAVRTHDLRDVVDTGDCVVDLQAGSGDIAWVLTRRGSVVHVDPPARPRAVVLPRSVAAGEGAGGGLLVAGGTAYASRGDAVTALRQAAGAAPRAVWTARVGGVATAPALVGGAVVVAVDPAGAARAEAVALEAGSGRQACRVPVFEDGAGRVVDRPLGVPDGVLLRNAHPDAGDGDALASLEVPGCRVGWTAGVRTAAPPTVSAATGLAYVVDRRWSPWLVPVTRLAAVDVRTGRRAYATRVATGPLGAVAPGVLALDADGAAYVGTRGGVLRVGDRGR